MEIKQISLKIDEELLEKIDNEAKLEQRDRSKQLIYMLKKYYEMKKILNNL